VTCVADADCTDPNARACGYPDVIFCFPCRTSSDCAQNADGPVCGNVGANEVGIGDCYCNADSDCVGHLGGPHCVGNVSNYRKCGCAAAADCAGDAEGHACVAAPFKGVMQCGCTTAAECPSGKTCSGSTATCY
jgi:hypothetical protein